MTDNRRAQRFYKHVEIENTNKVFRILLDSRPIKSRSGATLAAPTMEVAKAVRDEWAGQEDAINFADMPVTRRLMASLDASDGIIDQWRDEIISYLKADLLCYRAENNQALSSRQHDVWDPYLKWFAEIFGVSLTTTKGVVAIDQSETALENARNALQHAEPLHVLAIKNAASLTGSAVLALALWRNAAPAEEIFIAAKLDEHFQREVWGEDPEALKREEALKKDFLTEAKILQLAE